jgi:L-threonylcarbamoyladenylate synthase
MLRTSTIGVLLTDTIYGVVGSALSKKAVTRMYRIKGRNENKPFIILISSYADLARFGVKISLAQKKFLSKKWPGKVSVIFSVPAKKWQYLHRGTKSLAFRMPAPATLRGLIRTNGPVAAPSANPEGKPPATTITEAKAYFGEKVDFYIDGGKKKGKPSMLVRMDTNGTIEILRK